MNVYEEIMRMFSTITVEAGNALYSHDQSNQYRYCTIFVTALVFKHFTNAINMYLDMFQGL